MFMFGKSYREPKPEETSETTILNPLSTPTVDNQQSLMNDREENLQSSASQSESVTEISDLNTPEVVNTVEKISRIAAPYFIALVGLSLYKDNFFIGSILVGTGIISLLKISTKDIAIFVQWVKNLLGFNDNQP